ncbi:hypothetical protein [Staphylococcus auricularis]|nr:hypothetical protein [Staphylococcus auricularis]
MFRDGVSERGENEGNLIEKEKLLDMIDKNRDVHGEDMVEQL